MSRLSEILGVEEDDIFKIRESVSEYRIHGGHIEYSFQGSDWNVMVSASTLGKIIDNPSLIIRTPKLTTKELEICKVLGAKYVSRDYGEYYVELWSMRPEQIDESYYLGMEKTTLATVSSELFPSVNRMDCICVDEVQVV